MIAPKFLSDSLTPWYGYWASHPAAATISIAYDNLPTGDALARVYSSNLALANGGPGIVFNEPQNLNNCTIELYIKTSAVGATAMYIQFNNTIIPLPVGYASVYCYLIPAAVLTTWTRYTLNVSEIRSKTGFGVLSMPASQMTALLSRVKSIVLYSSIANPLDTMVSCFTIRRL